MGLFKKLTAKVKSVGRAIDPTALPVVGTYVKQAVATTAVTMTGGAVLLVRPDLLKPAVEGFKTGAIIGASIAGSPALGAAVRAGVNLVPTPSAANRTAPPAATQAPRPVVVTPMPATPASVPVPKPAAVVAPAAATVAAPKAPDAPALPPRGLIASLLSLIGWK